MAALSSSICILMLLTCVIRHTSINFICVLTSITYILTLLTYVLTLSTCILTLLTCVLTLSTLVLT